MKKFIYILLVVICLGQSFFIYEQNKKNGELMYQVEKQDGVLESYLLHDAEQQAVYEIAQKSIISAKKNKSITFPPFDFGDVGICSYKGEKGKYKVSSFYDIHFKKNGVQKVFFEIVLTLGKERQHWNFIPYQ